jgi:hypothetical protein
VCINSCMHLLRCGPCPLRMWPYRHKL